MKKEKTITHQADAVVMRTVIDLCGELNIKLEGEEGQPFCCGERMNVRGGLMGSDYAKCLKCGKTIGNMASPHINGGYIVDDEFFKKHGEATWIRLDA